MVGYLRLVSVTTWLGMCFMARLGMAMLCISKARLIITRGFAG